MMNCRRLILAATGHVLGILFIAAAVMALMILLLSE
jgi:hypothetical protein